ncbi:MAG: NADH-ubiquinone oxidoreductase-F iron-sulfur binding region domain-containing protein [Planctomycetota bacterium]|jgi:NADH-quinone oxidoreductase subunit F
MNYEQVVREARKEWEGLQNSGHPLVRVGTATCGRSAGAMEVFRGFEEGLKERGLEAGVVEVGCLGLCYAEPMATVAVPGKPTVCYGDVTEARAKELVENYLEKGDPMPDAAMGIMDEGALGDIPRFFDLPVMKPQVRRVLRNCGNIDPTSIHHYIANGGYGGLAKALSLSPADIVGELKASGLRGRGGAGFPTWRKWQFCIDAPGDEKFIICNADEGDPGAFMNRSLLEGDPHAILEGMIIAGFAFGAKTGYIYCRAEYPLALERLAIAIRQAEDLGFMGDDVMGAGFEFRIKVKEGAGAFVCGEETALIASIEAKRGMPRPRPPFPAVKGLWGKPTIINNVETLACVAAVFQNGADWFAEYGTENSKGTKTFALVGKVKRTGLIEVPLGTTLREIIFDVGGGIVGDHPYKAVQTGGPSGGCIPELLLDTPVDYDSLGKVGSIMGSGGMVVMDRYTCMVDVARYFLDFTRKESCGECVPCRLGTKKMLDVLEEITEGRGTQADVDLLSDLAEGIKMGSLCGLGQTAPNPVLTTLKYFPDEYQAHVKDKACPAAVCKALITYTIDPENCTGCRVCARACPADAITGEKKEVHVLDQEKCIKCNACFEGCKFDAVIKK